MPRKRCSSPEVVEIQIQYSNASKKKRIRATPVVSVQAKSKNQRKTQLQRNHAPPSITPSNAIPTSSASQTNDYNDHADDNIIQVPRKTKVFFNLLWSV